MLVTTPTKRYRMRLLIVHHTPSPHCQEMFEAVVAGATDPDGTHSPSGRSTGFNDQPRSGTNGTSKVPASISDSRCSYRAMASAEIMSASASSMTTLMPPSDRGTL